MHGPAVGRTQQACHSSKGGKKKRASKKSHRKGNNGLSSELKRDPTRRNGGERNRGGNIYQAAMGAPSYTKKAQKILIAKKKTEKGGKLEELHAGKLRWGVGES